MILYEEEWRHAPELSLSKLRGALALPFFVKPANLGSSVGITKVNNLADTAGALERAFLYDRKVLVEEGILGREIECSVLGNAQPRASLPGEIIPFREFYDYADKYLEGKTGFGIPADLPEKTSRKIQRLAVEAFQAVEGRGMARVDFFIEQGSGKIFLNEVNTIPGFTQISMYPKLWEASGIPFGRLLEDLIRLGLEKHKQKKRRDIMRILGIDYGDKNIGLAVSDALRITAQGLGLYRKQGKKQDLVYFQSLVKEHNISQIVIGMPLRMDGTEGSRGEKTKQFAQWLEVSLGLPIHFWDERLTTRDAFRILREQKASPQKKKAKKDQIAATLILAGWLESVR